MELVAKFNETASVFNKKAAQVEVLGIYTAEPTGLLHIVSREEKTSQATASKFVSYKIKILQSLLVDKCDWMEFRTMTNFLKVNQDILQNLCFSVLFYLGILTNKIVVTEPMKIRYF